LRSRSGSFSSLVGPGNRSLTQVGGETATPHKGFIVHSRGRGGLDDMVDDEKKVLFGLTRIVMGSGTFERLKLFFIHFNGQKAAVVKRGRANARMNDARTLLGTTSGSLTVTSAAECTLQNIMLMLQHCISEDGLQLDAIRAGYQQRLKEWEAQCAKAEPVGTVFERGCKLGVMGMIEAVQHISGPLNWILLHAAADPFKVFNAGLGSAVEMHAKLDPQYVLYGLLRMGFGAGKFKRTKWVFVHFIGDEVPPVKRGRQNALVGKMYARLACQGVSVLKVEATHPDQASLEAILDRVRRAAVIDGDLGDSSQSASAFSVEEFQAWLREEQRNNEEAAPAEEESDELGDLDVEATIRGVREAEGPFNWAFFEPR